MRSEKSAPGALLLNLLLLYIVYGITRLAFFLENYATYEHLVGADGWWSIVVGGLYFDTSAIAYTNALYVLLVLLPIPQKEGPLWQRICKWLFVVVNSLGLAMNLGDSVYFQYTARRTTIAFFSEFSGDEKLGSIVGYEFIQHWYLVLLFLVLAAVLWWCYVVPRVATVPRRRYYLYQCVSLLIAAYAVFAGIRGGLWDNRPIKISTANQFIIKPNDASLILNTPFTMIRTIGHSSYHNPAYFTSNSELESIYTPLHTPVADSTSQKKNIVVIFLESFGREYVGSLNSEVLPGSRLSASATPMPTAAPASMPCPRRSRDSPCSSSRSWPPLMPPTTSKEWPHASRRWVITRLSSTEPPHRASVSRDSRDPRGSSSALPRRITRPTVAQGVLPIPTTGGASGTSLSYSISV